MRQRGVWLWAGATLAGFAWSVPVSAQAAAPERSASGPPVRASWTSDRAPLRVGDVVTILIDEFTQVSADRAEVASRDRDRELGVSGSAQGTSAAASARTNNDVAQRNRGESSRRQSFQAEMSVRVTEIGPGGMLRVEGSRQVRVDKHVQEVAVRGWVRPHDVAVDNTIESWRVAEAEILYTSNGSLVSAGGMWTRLLELIVP